MTRRVSFVLVVAIALLTVGCTVGVIHQSDQDAGPTPDAGGEADANIAPDAAEGGVDAAVTTVPTELTPCVNGICWDTALFAAPCSYGLVLEDFSSHTYNVHAYAIEAHAGVPTEISLTRTGGTWQVALVVSDGVRTLSDGEVGRVEAGLDVSVIASGRSGSEARVTLTSDTDLALTVYVTSWQVIDADFAAPPLPMDSTYSLRVDRTCTNPPGHVAPPGALAGEVVAGAGVNTLEIGNGGWGAPLRVDALASEYIGFQLEFTPSGAAVDMEVLGWDGSTAVSLGITNDGPGVRVLAARDPDGARTFWVRAQGTPTDGTLTITRTPLSEVPPCPANCGDLLQLPLPVDAMAQGYDQVSWVVYRWQFGRRDMLTAIFNAGRQLAAAGIMPFTVKDMTKWDGSQPPDHETHNDGFHADIGLYDSSGVASWADACVNNGLRCTGAVLGFGVAPTTRLIAAMFETGIVSGILLDGALIPLVRAEADALLAAGTISSAAHALIQSAFLRHVDYHFHHIHIRVDGL